MSSLHPLLSPYTSSSSSLFLNTSFLPSYTRIFKTIFTIKGWCKDRKKQREKRTKHNAQKKIIIPFSLSASFPSSFCSLFAFVSLPLLPFCKLFAMQVKIKVVYVGFAALRSLSPLSLGRRLAGSACPICQSTASHGLVWTGLAWTGRIGKSLDNTGPGGCGPFLSSVQ